MNATVWARVYLQLLDVFVFGDREWEELLFKLWVVRVLNHTCKSAIRGFDFSRNDLLETIESYRVMDLQRHRHEG